jgi:hypothetical protein
VQQLKPAPRALQLDDAMAWNPYDDPVNHVILAGQQSPGLADVAGLGTPRNWDERQGYGLSGAIVVFTGNKIANFKVLIKLYTVADWEAYHAWRVLVQRTPPNIRPKALDFWHPFAEMQKIKSVVVTDEGQPEQTGDGEWTIPISFKEWRRPKIALAKPEGSQAKITDPAEQAIAGLTTIAENGGVGNVSQALAPLFAPSALQGRAQ